MDQIVFASVPRLTYFCDPPAIEAALATTPDSDLDVDPLIGGRCLSDHDHLVLATDPRSGGLVAALGADEGKTYADSYLSLVTWRTSIVPRPRLLRRMAAMLLLRVAGLHAVPHAVAASSDHPELPNILAEFAAKLSGSVLFAGMGEKVVPLHAAALARRIGRGIGIGRGWRTSDAHGHGARGSGSSDGRLAVTSGVPQLLRNDLASARSMPLPALLDLRSVPEAVLLDEARRLYRYR